MTRKLAALLILTLFIGCSNSGVDRCDLYGRVTYKGQPVPFGRIVFEPDRSKGNDGPQGTARIINGEYHTGKTGKGAVTGAIVVLIDGYRSMPETNEGGDSRPLFQGWTTRIELDPDQSKFDFEIP